MKNHDHLDGQTASGFSVKDVSKIELESEETITFHVHKYAEFLRILDGTLLVTVHGQTISLKKNEVLVIFKGIPHSLSVEKDNCCIFYSLHCHPFYPDNHAIFNHLMSDTYLASLVDFSFRFKNFFLFGPDRFATQCIDTIFFEFSSRDLYYEKNAQLQMYSLLLLFLRKMHCSAAEKNFYTNQYLIPAFEYIKINYPHKIMVSDIAHHCNVSPRYLSKLFLSFCDVPISHFLNSFRIDKAIEIITSMSCPLSLTEIATAVGFSSLQHFSKVFKKEIGISPKHYQLLLNSKHSNKKTGNPN